MDRQGGADSAASAGAPTAAQRRGCARGQALGGALPCLGRCREPLLDSIDGPGTEPAGRVLFAGIVDEQVLSESGDGITVELSARSRAALLLDNEARPQIYYMPSLKLMFERHAAPYGFTGYLGRDRGVWRGIHGGKGNERVAGAGGLLQNVSGGAARSAGGCAGRVRLGTAGAGGCFPLALAPLHMQNGLEGRRPHFGIAQLRTGDAADYDAILQDEEAVARGVVRRRYLSGSDVEQGKGRVAKGPPEGVRRAGVRPRNAVPTAGKPGEGGLWGKSLCFGMGSISWTAAGRSAA